MASAPAPSPILLQASIASYLVAAAASSSGFKPPPCPLRTVLLKPIEVCLFCLESCNGSQGAQSKSQSPSRGPQGPMWAALPSPLRSCPSPFVPLLLCSSHTGHPAVARHPAVFPPPSLCTCWSLCHEGPPAWVTPSLLSFSGFKCCLLLPSLTSGSHPGSLLAFPFFFSFPVTIWLGRF